MKNGGGKLIFGIAVVGFILWTQNQMFAQFRSFDSFDSFGPGLSTFPTVFRIMSVVVALTFARQIYLWFKNRNRDQDHTSGLPEAGEYWMARVPYEDGTGSKDRPCLVLDGSGAVRTVLYVTSQNKEGDPCYVRVDNSHWNGAVARRRSWLRVAQRDGSDPRLHVATGDFRRMLGPVSPLDAAEVRSRGVPAAF